MQVRFPDGNIQNIVSAQSTLMTTSGGSQAIQITPANGGTPYVYKCASVAEQARFLYQLINGLQSGLVFVDLMSEVTIGGVSLSPTGGSVSGGTGVAITITGSPGSCRQDVTVTFGGLPAQSVVWLYGTLIFVTTPPHAAATVDVVVKDSNSSFTASSAYTYS